MLSLWLLLLLISCCCWAYSYSSISYSNSLSLLSVWVHVGVSAIFCSVISGLAGVGVGVGGLHGVCGGVGGVRCGCRFFKRCRRCSLSCRIFSDLLIAEGGVRGNCSCVVGVRMCGCGFCCSVVGVNVGALLDSVRV